MVKFSEARLSALSGGFIGKMSQAAKGRRDSRLARPEHRKRGIWIIQDLIFHLNLEYLKFRLLVTNFLLRSLLVNLSQDLSRLEQVSPSKKSHLGVDSVGLTGFFAIAPTDATPPTNLLCLLTLFANHSWISLPSAFCPA
jgi:hypothetical protein